MNKFTTHKKRAPKVDAPARKKPNFAYWRKLRNKPFTILIRATFNNVFFTASDSLSNVIGTYSIGYAGFKGSTRTTQFALAEAGKKFGMRLLTRLRNMKSRAKFIVIFRTAATAQILGAVQGMRKVGVPFVQAIYKPAIPHNGMRGRKVRRV